MISEAIAGTVYLAVVFVTLVFLDRQVKKNTVNSNIIAMLLLLRLL